MRSPGFGLQAYLRATLVPTRARECAEPEYRLTGYPIPRSTPVGSQRGSRR